jgi:ABC-type polysaccharide/polyol phosphate transport system ATPase subunit
VCVSHNTGILRELCEHAMWLDHGRVVMRGNTADVLRAYSSGAAAVMA